MEQPFKSIIQSYTLNMEVIAKLSCLAEQLGVNKSEIVRRAIVELYEKLNPPTPQTEVQS